MRDLLPRIVLAPTFAISLTFIYGFTIWTGYLSLSKSRMLPNYDWVGISNYFRLFGSDRFQVALTNLVIFGTLYVGFTILIGVVLAIFLDQKIRAEGALRTVFLYPMAVSFMVTGTAWRWILNPGLGIERAVRDWGFESFTFDWIVRPEMAIFTVVIAGVWQTSGFVMALFLAGLRSVDDNIINAAEVDGAKPVTIYWRVVLPLLRPIFFSACVVVGHMAVKSFELVLALTNGGPGYATDLPATFFYAVSYSRDQLAIGSASAMVLLFVVAAIAVPFMYSELVRKG